VKISEVKDVRELRRRQAIIRAKNYCTFGSWTLPLTVVKKINRRRAA